MQLLSFIKGLLPRFKKDKLQEDIEICSAEFKNSVLPSYLNAIDGFSKITSKDLKAFEKTWFTYIKNPKKTTLIRSMYEKLLEASKTIETMDKYSEKEFNDEIITQGLSVLKATIIRMTEVLDFTATFSLRFLNYAYIAEKAALDPSIKIEDEVSQGELNLIKTYFLNFCLGLNAVCQDPQELEKKLTSIPDILVNADTDAAIKAFGISKVDPTAVFNIRGFIGSPIYRFAQAQAEAQAWRYKASKEMKSILELRLLDLQKTAQGNPDAGIQKEIEIIQSRIDGLQEKIRRIEEQVA